MSLNHQFGIVRAKLSDYLRWKNWKPLSFRQMVALMPAPISLHDDIMHYVLDSLNWIPCYNPAKQEKHQGLNLCGVTLIAASGARKAAGVFRTWAALFSLGPETLTLTGGWTAIVGSNNPGKYSLFRPSRRLLVKNLIILSNQCDEVAGAKNENFILHLGV